MTMFFSLMLTLLPTRASFLAEEFSAWITPKKKVFKGIDKQDQHEETLGVIKSSMCFFLLEKEEFSRCVCSYRKLTMIERYCYFVYEYWMNNSNKSSWSKSFNIYYNVYVKSYLSAALIRRWVAKNWFQKGKLFIYLDYANGRLKVEWLYCEFILKDVKSLSLLFELKPKLPKN